MVKRMVEMLEMVIRLMVLRGMMMMIGKMIWMIVVLMMI